LTERPAAPSSALRSKVSTGYARLDEALQGGFLAGSAIVLSAPASDEVPVLLRRFLEADPASLLISRSLSSAEPVLGNRPDGVKCLVCSDKPVPPAQNILPGKGIENLTEPSLTITETLNSIQPSRLVVQLLSDVLLRHKALQTRKWLSELLDKFRAKNITTLVVLNPFMHSSEEVQAIVDLFNGNIELIEKQVEGQLRKSLVIKWMHGIEVAEKEVSLSELHSSVSSIPEEGVHLPTSVFTEPRWVTPLVNRSEELSKLKSAFQDSLARKSTLIALEGEAGVGKSRLARELAVYAESQGAIVLTGRATKEKLPYGPWIELAREYISQLPGEMLRKLLGTHTSEFGRLIPDITAKIGTIPPSKPLEEHQDRIRLYDAMTQFLISISKQTSLLLLLEDMQYVDQASLSLLEYFVRSSNKQRLMTVCCYRSEDVDANSPLYETRLNLNKERLLESINVKNLNEEQTTDLMREIFGEKQITNEFSELIYHRTRGNPFFVEEVLRALVEDGIIFRTEKGWDRKTTSELIVPESVKATLRNRLAKLSPDALAALISASVVGSEFDFELLREVTKLDEDSLLSRLETGLSAGLIEEIPRRRGLFRFTDDRVRELLLGDLSQIRKARHHMKVAEAAEKVWSKDLDSHAELLAYHFSEGGDTEHGLKYSVIAGERNESIHAYEQAVTHYKRALDLVDIPGGDEGKKAELSEKLGDCFAFVGQLPDSTKCYEQALAIYEKLHDTKACARAYRGLADISARGKTSYADMARLLRQGLKYVEEEPESYEAAWIYAELGNALGLLDQYEEANVWVEKALQAGEKAKNYGAVAEALALKGSALTDTGKVDEGLPLWERGLEIALQHENYSQAMFYLLNLGFYTYPRDLSKATKLARRLVEMSETQNDLFWKSRGTALLSFLEWLAGSWVTALEIMENSFDLQQRLGLRGGWSEAFRAYLFLSKGDLELAEKALLDLLESLREDQKISHNVLCHLGLGNLRFEQGRVEDARRHFETCADTFKKWEFTTLPLAHVEALTHLTRICVQEGEAQKAQEFYQWAQRIAEQLRSDAGLAMTAQAEASLLTAQGNKKSAEEAYIKSLGLWEKAGWPYYHATALVEYAEAIAKTSPEEYRRRLGEAVEIFKKLGAKRDLEMNEAKLSAK
jgi:predicted ATPase